MKGQLTKGFAFTEALVLCMYPPPTGFLELEEHLAAPSAANSAANSSAPSHETKGGGNSSSRSPAAAAAPQLPDAERRWGFG